MSPLQERLLALVSQYRQYHLDNFNELPKVEHDPAWPSPCEVGQPDTDNLVNWQPVAINESLSFDNVEKALDLTLHSDIKNYFTSVYSEAIPCSCKEGDLELLFAWNFDDFQRLQQNLIGHVLMKRRLKQSPTLFFAVTDAEEINLVIDNETGAVWAEPVGLEPNKLIAPSLVDFIDMLAFKKHD
ncbi:SecY-interacting protein [Thalassotalea maritima]|uniref:SecY-interacting protein n=1 Tax=Thalassotalea maritima TaxID=3242416 RepID=UPI00352715D4